MMNSSVGAQLYTVRDFAKTPADVRATFEKVAKIGYRSVQVSGLCPMDAAELASIAKDTGLTIALTHTSYDRLVGDLKNVMKEHAIFGCKIIGLGCMPAQFQDGAEGVDAFVKEFNPIAKELKKNGFLFGYHNHAFEFQRFDGRYIFDRLVEDTDPEAFQFILDTYWLQYGGKSPEKIIRSLKGRIATLHLKDLKIENFSDIKMAEIFNGNLDWPGIVAAAKEAGAPWYMVEQDICPGDPFESLTISYNNLAKSGLFI